MDRLVYVAMSGAREAMRAQGQVAHNLANLTTTGYRAVHAQLTSAPLNGQGLPSRVGAASLAAASDFATGPLSATGRELDVAIRGQGWLAVQAPDGSEALTRAGALRIGTTGLLETAQGHLVMGNGGPVSVPPHEAIYIGDDGQVSIIPEGQNENTMADVDRLKLVNPDPAIVQRRADGLFELGDGSAPEADAAVRVTSGHLESSNVNAAQALIDMITLSRHYETQVRTMNAAQENDESATRLMRLSG